MIVENEFFDPDKNIIKILENDSTKEEITKLNQEKLKIALQITGVKISLSVQLSEDIIQSISISSDLSLKISDQNPQNPSQNQNQYLMNKNKEQNTHQKLISNEQETQNKSHSSSHEQLDSSEYLQNQQQQQKNAEKTPELIQKTNSDKLDSIQQLKELNWTEITKKQFQEFVATKFIQKGYDKKKAQNYYQRILLACQILDKKFPLIILLGGTSGTGKSTVGSLLASRFGISTALSTDTIRQILRNFMKKQDCPPLFVSTYQAGQALSEENLGLNEKFIKEYFDNLDQIRELSEQDKTIKGYKLQSKVVQDRLEFIVDQYAQRKEPIIIEGVHLTPNFMFKLMKKYDNVIPFAICIKDEKKHKERFAVRSKYMTLDKRHNKYIKNFMNIRLIQKWFLQKANQYLIPCVNNVNIDKSLGIVHKTVLRYRNRLNSDQIIFKDLKNAYPLYEEYNKATKNVWSSQQIKDMINSKVDPKENIERYLKDVISYQEKLQSETENQNQNLKNINNSPENQKYFQNELQNEKKNQQKQQQQQQQEQEQQQQEIQDINDIQMQQEQTEQQYSQQLNSSPLQPRLEETEKMIKSQHQLKVHSPKIYKNKSMTDDERGTYTADEEDDEEEDIEDQNDNNEKNFSDGELEAPQQKQQKILKEKPQNQIKLRTKKVSFDGSDNQESNEKKTKKVSFLTENPIKKSKNTQFKQSKSFCYSEESQQNDNEELIQQDKNGNNDSIKTQQFQRKIQKPLTKTKKYLKSNSLFQLRITPINSQNLLKPKEAIEVLKKEGVVKIMLGQHFSRKLLKKYLELHKIKVQFYQNQEGVIFVQNLELEGKSENEKIFKNKLEKIQISTVPNPEYSQSLNMINSPMYQTPESPKLIQQMSGNSHGRQTNNTDEYISSDQVLSMQNSQNLTSPRISISDQYSDQFDTSQQGVSIKNNTNYTLSEKISEVSSLKIYNESDNYEQEREDEELDELGNQVFDQIEEEGYDSENEEAFDMSGQDSDENIMEKGLDEDDVIENQKDDNIIQNTQDS